MLCKYSGKIRISVQHLLAPTSNKHPTKNSKREKALPSRGYLFKNFGVI